MEVPQLVRQPNRARCWCGTLNVPEFNSDWESILKSFPNLEYMVAGKEIAPTTGQKHYQFFLKFKNPISFSTLQSTLPTAHYEPSKASLQQNFDYCTKGGDFFEFGDRPDFDARFKGILYLASTIEEALDEMDDIPDWADAFYQLAYDVADLGNDMCGWNLDPSVFSEIQEVDYED